MKMDELLDLVDIHNQVIGTIYRTVAHAQKITSFRAVYCFIENSQGKLWVGLRPAHKAVHPSTLDLGVAGHVSSGEEYEQSLIREIAEEIAIDLPLARYEQLGLLTPHEHNMPSFGKVYRLRTDIEPRYTADDFVEHYWLAPEEIIMRGSHGPHKIKPDWHIALQKFYAQ
jgi:isopentenyldiphosphate isomerase